MRRVCLFLIVLAAVGLVTSEELCAQNNPVYFPYVVNDGKTTTELLFTNTTSSRCFTHANWLHGGRHRDRGAGCRSPSALSGCGQLI